MIKNLKTTLLLWVGAMILLAPAGGRAQDFPPDIQAIVDRKSLVIAMVEKDQPPFFMVGEEGELFGLDVDLAKRIAREFGVRVVFNRSSKTFNGTVALVAEKKADIAISKLSRTLIRARKVLFTKPYIVLRKGLLINRLGLAKATRGQDVVQFIKNYNSSIGVITASSYVGFARRMFPSATLREYRQWEEVTAAVASGEVLAAFRDELEVKKVIRGNPEAVLTLQSVAFTDTEDPIAMAVAADSVHLLFWLNEYLDSLGMEMDADKLLRKYHHVLFRSQQ